MQFSNITSGGSDEYQSASIGGTANFVCNGECSSVSWHRSRPDNCPTTIQMFRGDIILCETIVLDQQFDIASISLNRCRLTLKKVTSADGGRYFCISKKNSGQFQGFTLLLKGKTNWNYGRINSFNTSTKIMDLLHGHQNVTAKKLNELLINYCQSSLLSDRQYGNNCNSPCEKNGKSTNLKSYEVNMNTTRPAYNFQ